MGKVTKDGDVFWLWQNGDHFLAFDNLYPCEHPDGDPLTLGEPVGRAIFRESECARGREHETPPAEKPWFSNAHEAVRWMRREARQWHDDNPAVAAHLFEAATMLERADAARRLEGKRR